MTAEVAVTFPVVLLALAVVLLAGSVARAGVACVDGARAAARAVSAGEPAEVAVGHARGVLDRPARVDVGTRAAPTGSSGPGLVQVSVSLDVVPAFVPSWTSGSSWGVPVTCRVAAWPEPVA
ncbi:hypothetical protein [Aquipuribacter sp. MA13-6]|uniref:hypothetical protein n=1 Tax=unclassified Aquipuribacter TaxID=2635084 RepID=UPI003EEE076E